MPRQRPSPGAWNVGDEIRRYGPTSDARMPPSAVCPGSTATVTPPPFPIQPDRYGLDVVVAEPEHDMAAETEIVDGR